MDSKIAFIEDYRRKQLSFAALCRRHGISRTCGYKWVERFRQGGLEGLQELSRRPQTSPLRSSARVEQAVVTVRNRHPVWGGRKIRKVLQREGCRHVPAPSTVTNILRRHNLLGAGTREGSPNVQRFERSEPNDLWQMDFKGWFELGNRKRCYPLTALDDHSRYNLILEACVGESNKDVRPVLSRAFQRYGLPRQILCDHGKPWGGGSLAAHDYITSFEVWLLRLGVEVIHGRVRHPQTQGKEERFHRTLKAEVLDRSVKWRTHADCQKALTQWQRIYNTERPHESLDYRSPSEVYCLSHRNYPRELPKPESFYLEDDILRTVKSKGEITFKNACFYIGGALIGEPIALRPLGLGGKEADTYGVFYCWKPIGSINLKNIHKQKGRYHSITPQKV